MQTDAARSAGMDEHIRLIAWMAPAEPPIATTRRKPSLILSPSPSGRALARCLSGAAGATGSSRLPVDARSGEPGQKLVGFDLLLQRLVEEVRGLFHAKFVGPGLERPVAGDFIVLHGLPGSDERRIERVGALELVHEFLGLVDDAEDRLAGLAARGLSHLLENLVEALDVLFGRVAMGLESVLELRRHRLLGHFRQGSQNLLLREIDVLQRLGEKILERIGGLHLCHFSARPCCGGARTASCAICSFRPERSRTVLFLLVWMQRERAPPCAAFPAPLVVRTPIAVAERCTGPAVRIWRRCSLSKGFGAETCQNVKTQPPRRRRTPPATG